MTTRERVCACACALLSVFIPHTAWSMQAFTSRSPLQAPYDQHRRKNIERKVLNKSKNQVVKEKHMLQTDGFLLPPVVNLFPRSSYLRRQKPPVTSNHHWDSRRLTAKRKWGSFHREMESVCESVWKGTLREWRVRLRCICLVKINRWSRQQRRLEKWLQGQLAERLQLCLVIFLKEFSIYYANSGLFLSTHIIFGNER